MYSIYFFGSDKSQLVFNKFGTRKLSKSVYSDPSPGRHAINCSFPRRVAKKSFTLHKTSSTFWVTIKKYLLTVFLSILDGSQLVQKSNSKQPLSEFRSWQETLTCLLLLDVRVPDAVVAFQVQVQAVVTVRLQSMAVKLAVRLQAVAG